MFINGDEVRFKNNRYNGLVGIVKNVSSDGRYIDVLINGHIAYAFDYELEIEK